MNPEEFKEFMKLINEIQNSPGQLVVEEVDRMKRALRLVLGNKEQVVRLIQILQRPDVAHELSIETNRDASHHAMDEIARTLHNFLASAYSLVDYMRHHRSRLYKGLDFEGEIDREITNRFKQDNHHIIAQGLRNYVLHFRIAPIQTTFTLTPSGKEVGDFDLKSSYELPVELLLQSNEWTTEQKKALARIGEKLDILSFVEAYFSKVESFYQWLWERQASFHADDIEATNQLRDRARAIYEAS